MLRSAEDDKYVKPIKVRRIRKSKAFASKCAKYIVPGTKAQANVTIANDDKYVKPAKENTQRIKKSKASASKCWKMRLRVLINIG